MLFLSSSKRHISYTKLARIGLPTNRQRAGFVILEEVPAGDRLQGSYPAATASFG